MTNQELTCWLKNKFNSCYQIVNDDGDIEFYYNEQYLRLLKLSRIKREAVNKPKSKYHSQDINLFKLDMKNEYFFYDLDNIYIFLKDNIEDKDIDISKFIGDVLLMDTKYQSFTSQGIYGLGIQSC